MYAWEARLCFQATNRVVRPFEWGLDWTRSWPGAAACPRNGHDEESWLRILNRESMRESDQFFGYAPPTDFSLSGDMLTFRSPVATPHAENNCVRARWFPARKTTDRAVLVLPHWNAHAQQHAALCRGLSRLGVSALRLSLPYHDERMPAETRRADYAVSANVGRTIDATRQAVIDARCCADWLMGRGYTRLGIVGTSLGSCYAFLASAHDARFRVNVFNHCSTHFADVVWTGLSTRHIRESMENHIDVDRLREVWRAISPVSYMDRYAAHPKKSLFIWARYDSTFLPEFTRDVLARLRDSGIEHKEVVMPCGHYTLGKTPFQLVDGYQLCAFFLRHL